MYILEIHDPEQRLSALIEITNRVFDTSFEHIEDARIIHGFSYLATSTLTKTNKIGVADVHLFKKIYWLRSSAQNKLAIINNAHNLTTESQNALLKDLEEEPDHTITILAVSDKRKLLPTILSRGIHLKSSDISAIFTPLTQEKFPDIVYNAHSKKKDLQHIDKFLNLSFFDQLVYINKQIVGKKTQQSKVMQDKEDQVESFLHDLLSYYESLLEKKEISSVAMIALIEDGLRKLERGVNERAVLEYIILKIHYG
jgi:DNA polymerase III gamma/tau subunit